MSRDRPPTARRSRVQVGRIVLAMAVAGLGLWVGAQTLGVAVAKGNPALAASLNGSNAGIMTIQLQALLEAARIGAAVPVARDALRHDPTAITGLQVLGLAAQAKGDVTRAQRLLDHAQHLSRRDLGTHMWAIEDQVERGDTDAVLRQYDLTLRTSLAARDLLFPVLGNAIAEQSVAAKLIGRLRQKPLWFDAFLFYVATDSGVVPETAVGFLRQARAAGLVTAPDSLAALASRSLAAGNYRTAWSAYALKRPGVDPHRLRDPMFTMLPEAPAPFDWSLSNDGSILARAVDENGVGRLEIEAGSGSAGLAAGQTQMLPPGNYRLEVDAAAIPQGAGLGASIVCQNGPELAKLMLSGAAARHVSPAFVVPASCEVQDLHLTADAGESPDGLRTTVTRVTIVPADR